VTTLSPEDAVRLRAIELHQAERLRAHEAGHCAAALLTGLPVSSITAPTYTIGELLADSDPDAAAGSVVICADLDDPDELRKYALCLLAGHLEEGPGLGDTVWPPVWPLVRTESEASDEAKLIKCVEALKLDRAGYGQLKADAHDLVCSRPFERLVTAISHLLEQRPHLDGPTLLKVKAATQGDTVEYLLLKATTLSTDQGTFEAVISTEAVDREKDIVSAPAMVSALRKWNRPIPVCWNHSTSAADIFGTLDPQSVRAIKGEVHAGGQVDLDSTVGQEAWRAFKSRSVGFSFGHLLIESTPRPGGGRHIHALDVFGSARPRRR
jgi:hypothetical protein